MASSPDASASPFPVTDASDPPMQPAYPPGQVAPAGPWFTDAELPSVAVAGGAPATLGGYSPDPSQTPQMTVLPPATPTGIRR